MGVLSAMDEKTRDEIINDMMNNQLALDDTFDFKCRECGKCCKNREDIILTARDLFNIAKLLGRTAEQILDKYCEFYIGSTSQMLLVRLKPTGHDNSCPLLFKRRCIVHQAKPTVCALFPLGRGYSYNVDMNISNIEPQYFLQSIYCGTKGQLHTVRSWLEKFGMPANDEFYPQWTFALMLLSEFFMNIEKLNKPEEVMKQLRWGAFALLYLGFDTSKDFLPQFTDRVSKLLEQFESPEKVDRA